MFRTTRRAFLWIILPMVSCMVAGFLATVNGVTNMLLTLWLVVYGGCVIESIVEIDFALGKLWLCTLFSCYDSSDWTEHCVYTRVQVGA